VTSRTEQKDAPDFEQQTEVEICQKIPVVRAGQMSELIVISILRGLPVNLIFPCNTPRGPQDEVRKLAKPAFHLPPSGIQRDRL
jgi:hypothetical protein